MPIILLAADELGNTKYPIVYEVNYTISLKVMCRSNNALVKRTLMLKYNASVENQRQST